MENNISPLPRPRLQVHFPEPNRKWLPYTSLMNSIIEVWSSTTCCLYCVLEMHENDSKFHRNENDVNETIELLREKITVRRGVHNYLPRSSDWTPCDFFRWGHVKDKVFANSLASMQDLNDGILCDLIIENCMKRIWIRRRGRGGLVTDAVFHFFLFLMK